MLEYLTTKELAELLRIKERKVYDLAASGAVPCSKAMGKLLFPRDGVDAWLARGGSGLDAPSRGALANVFLGSHDPLLDWALKESRCGIATYFDGSVDGLERFVRREGIATGLHLYDASHDDWNTPLVAERCAGMAVVLVQWATRRRGLIVGEDGGRAIGSVSDLKGRRVVPRQPEAGAQALFLHLLAQAGLTVDDLEWTAPARTEVDAALMVLEGKAEAALGLAALAAQYRLPFVPILEERFDLLVDRRAWFEPPMQAFLNLCRSDMFVARAGDLEGYDVANFGRVHYNGP